MKSYAPSMAGGRGGVAEDAPMARESERPAVPPILASFSAYPPSITAGVATDITWSYQYANAPWPEPACTVDQAVGRIHSGMAKSLTLDASTSFTLTCANSAGRSQKQARINVVKIEAKFDVAEYQIVILSAAEAAGLEQWLKLNGYKIPEDAEPLLRPYVEAGSKFFVAKVDPKKVQMVDGHAALSPLRFHYDSDQFVLPIRLGLANSGGTQDLIVSILAPNQRYELANYKNVTIPTNLEVKDSVRERFGAFYAALFDRTVERNPGAVVTEYAWQATTCDPCPGPTLTMNDFMTLGADVLDPGQQIAAPPPRAGGAPAPPMRRRVSPGFGMDFVLTRLHARYGKDLKDDLVFKAAPPIVGGREFVQNNGKLEEGAQASSVNNFQGRYAIRHRWTGAITCKNPRRGIWGGPPSGGGTAPQSAMNLAFAPRGQVQLPASIAGDVPEIGLKKGVLEPVAKPK